MHGTARPLVQGRLLSDPEVDLPVQGLVLVLEGVEHDIAVTLEELAVRVVFRLNKRI